MTFEAGVHERDIDKNEALESDFHMPFTDCDGCQKPHCLMCSVRRLCEWRPNA